MTRWWSAVVPLMLVASAKQVAGQAVEPPSPVRLELARTMLALTGAEAATGQFLASTAGMRQQLPQVPQATWDSLEARIQRVTLSVVDSMVPVYAARFSEAELRDVIAFYQSPVGRQLLAEQPRIAQLMYPVVQRAMQGPMQQFLQEIRP